MVIVHYHFNKADGELAEISENAKAEKAAEKIRKLSCPVAHAEHKETRVAIFALYRKAMIIDCCCFKYESLLRDALEGYDISY